MEDLIKVEDPLDTATLSPQSCYSVKLKFPPLWQSHQHFPNLPRKVVQWLGKCILFLVQTWLGFCSNFKTFARWLNSWRLCFHISKNGIVIPTIQHCENERMKGTSKFKASIESNEYHKNSRYYLVFSFSLSSQYLIFTKFCNLFSWKYFIYTFFIFLQLWAY